MGGQGDDEHAQGDDFGGRDCGDGARRALIRTSAICLVLFETR